jgi:hypothetical protein
MKRSVIFLGVIVLIILGTFLLVSATEVDSDRGPIVIKEVEVQVDGVDMICLSGYYKSMRYGLGLSCDWPQNNANPTSVSTPVMPIPTSTPKPY